MALYDVGDLIRSTVECRGLGGALTDPTTLKFLYKDPSGNKTTVVYGVGAIVKDATGRFHYDLTIDEGGVWSIRWEGTDAVQASEEKVITVKATAF